MRNVALTLSLFSVSLSCAPLKGPAAPVMPDQPVVRGEAADRIHRYLEGIQHFGFSGAVLVANPRGVVLRNGYGPAGAGRRVTSEMVFDMGSITKQFTAAAILLLEAEGRLSTGDSLARFFPALPSDKRGITLHQLLTHSSGIISDFAGDYDQVSRDSSLRAIFNAPLLAPPGREFNYSNAGFSLLAMIIEQLSGQDYERFMRERIYAPIGMRHTGYVVEGLDSALVANSFTPPVDHGTPAERLARAGGPGWNLKGNGGVLTTVDDLYRYELALAKGRPINYEIQAKQFAEQFRRGPNLAHGYDWWIEPAGEDGVALNRAGDGPATGVSAEYRRYPRDSSVFLLLANNRHHGASTRRYVMPALRRLYRGDSIALPAVRSGGAELDAIVGTYAVDSSAYFLVTRVGDHLALSAVGQRAVNVMIFNRDSNSIRSRDRLNGRALTLVRALAADDTAALRSIFGARSDLARHREWWRTMLSRHGAFECVAPLGTDRLDRGVFLSTVRLRFRSGARTVRWAWSGPTPAVSSEDAMLPGVFSFGAESPLEVGAWSPYWWLHGRDSLVTYDMAFAQTLTGSVLRDDGGVPNELVFHVPGAHVRARRVPNAQHVSPRCEP
jgi:CubicO group peptidase (beta-lactamase class C family)